VLSAGAAMAVAGNNTLASTTVTAIRRTPARTPGLINLRHMTKMLLSCSREESKLCSELPAVQGCETAVVSDLLG